MVNKKRTPCAPQFIPPLIEDGGFLAHGVLKIDKFHKKLVDFGPSDRIRTCGILLPKQARYQLRYTRVSPSPSGGGGIQFPSHHGIFTKSSPFPHTSSKDTYGFGHQRLS